MALISIDIESYYDQDYSLSRMSETSYILDPRFETILASVKVGAGETQVSVGHDEVARRLAEIDWANSALLSHNIRFDGAILAWRFGHVPKLYLDTLSLARATTHWVIGRSSLAKVAQYLGLPPKGEEVVRAKGKRLADFTRDELAAYAAYCIRDNELCYAIFQKMRRCFRASELHLIDLVARMFILPQVRLNPDILDRNYQEVLAEKERLMAEVETIPKSQLSSNPQFAALLREHGVEVPMKTSPTTGQEIPALAKGDWQFKELCQDDELPAFVQALLAARVAVKSTLEETRSRNLLALSKTAWPGQGVGWFPVPLKFSGARTHRLSGDGGINCMHPDIELLTPAGWQRVEDWQPGTALMQWWPDGQLSWCTDAIKVRRENCEELVWFEGPAIRGGFTPDHRMVSVSSYTGEIKERSAGWIADHSGGLDNVPKSGIFTGNGLISQVQARVLCMLAADGHFTNKGNITLGFKKLRKIERCAALLKAADITYTCNVNNDVTTFRIKKTDVACWMVKKYGSWVIDLQPCSADALLDELIHWDGHPNSRTEACTFFTIHRDQAEWVQTLGAIRGRRASLYEYEFAEASTGRKFHVYFGTSRYASTRKGGVTRQSYGGTAYCPSVNSSFVLARYDSSIFVTGQCQNLPRGSLIRQAVEAPPGYRIVHRDASQIEARMLAWMARCDYLLKAFAEGRDVYSEFASIVYRETVSKEDKLKRFVGKTAILGLGYSCGAERFRQMLFIGNGGISVKIDEARAQDIVYAYRDTFPEIPSLWSHFDWVARYIIAMNSKTRYHYPPTTGYYAHIPIEPDFDSIVLPNDLRISYPDIREGEYDQLRNRAELVYSDPHTKTPKKIFGAKVVENISQALSRIIVTDIAIRVYTKTGYRPFLSTHDSLDYCVPAEEAEAIDVELTRQFAIVPAWAEGLPLASEGGWGANLAAAERGANQ